MAHVNAFVGNPGRVVAAVVRRGDRYLVCQRPIGKRHGGLWEFPGGKQEPNESDAETVSRELHEELNVRLRSVGPELCEIRDPGAPFVIAFVSVEIVGEPLVQEHQDLRWATLAEMHLLPLVPVDREFIQALPFPPVHLSDAERRGLHA